MTGKDRGTGRHNKKTALFHHLLSLCPSVNSKIWFPFARVTVTYSSLTQLPFRFLYQPMSLMNEWITPSWIGDRFLLPFWLSYGVGDTSIWMLPTIKWIRIWTELGETKMDPSNVIYVHCQWLLRSILCPICQGCDRSLHWWSQIDLPTWHRWYHFGIQQRLYTAFWVITKIYVFKFSRPIPV